MTVRQRAIALALGVVVVIAALWRVFGSPSSEEDLATDVVVHVQAVTQATLHRYVTAYGIVEPRPALESQPAGGALVSPFLDGVLAGVEVAEGQRVAAGVVLFRLDDRMTRIAAEGARAQADFAENALQRQEQLLATDGTSQRAYQEALRQRDAARAELHAAETALGYMDITAPLAGVVTRINARPGQRVDAGTVLAQVVDLDRLVVAASVPAREIGGVSVGESVLLDRGDESIQGTVLAMGRDVDPATGTYRVLASVPAGTGFRPGQFTDIRIVAEEHAGVLAVPERSVITRPDEGTWIVLVEGDQAVRHPVTVGLRDRGLVEVSGEGLEEGMRIVTDEAYELPQETKVRVVSS